MSVTGWRFWRLCNRRPDTSISVIDLRHEYGAMYPKGLTLWATTRADEWEGPVHHAHVVPRRYPMDESEETGEWSKDAMSGGLYAMKHPLQLLASFPLELSMSTNYIFGRVELWGPAVEHEHGWRAQHGIIRELFVDWTKIQAVALTLQPDLYLDASSRAPSPATPPPRRRDQPNLRLLTAREIQWATRWLERRYDCPVAALRLTKHVNRARAIEAGAPVRVQWSAVQDPTTWRP